MKIAQYRKVDDVLRVVKPKYFVLEMCGIVIILYHIMLTDACKRP